MNFYYLKIGKGNSLAEDWLSGKNPLGEPAVVIFYKKVPLKELIEKNTQVRDYYESSLPNARENTIMVVVGGGKAWFLKPAGKYVEIKPPKNALHNRNDIWRMIPVQILISGPLELKDVPPVLAGINANAYLSRGTYRKITQFRNIFAIYSVLKLHPPQDYLTDQHYNVASLLSCLSSIELETLVAKVFEAAGCFVPAYRGGCVRDVDLFVYNDRSERINLEGLVIPPHEGISVQIKSGDDLINKRPDSVDCLIGLRVSDLPGCYSAEWLYRQVKTFPSVTQWLKRSLHWLPKDYLQKYNL